MLIQIRRIKVGERRREEMGDIANLAESIKRHGLIHPVVVDADLNLVAGERRLRACQLLGWEKIEVRQLGELSARELRLLELEENIRRKDLTEYEKSKAMVAYKEAITEAPEFRTDSVQKSGGRGRPSKADSKRRVSEATGIPPSTIRGAETHVSTAEKLPAMRSWPQYRVLEAREYIDKLREEEHQAVNKLLSEPFTPPDTGLKIVRNLAAKTPEQRAEIYAVHESDGPYQRSQALTMADDLPPMMDQRIVLTQEALRLLRKAADLSDDA